MNQTAHWAKEILNSNAVILDTETTGGAKTDQIIQLSIIDMAGRTLFDSLLRPTCAINPFAAKVHNLTERHLRNAPPYPDVHEVVKSTLYGRTVIAYNITFDRRSLIQTAQAFKLDSGWIERLDWQCAMRAHSEYLGVGNAPKLQGGDHTALGDCLATLKLLRRMAGVEEKQTEPEPEPVKEITIICPVRLVTGADVLAYLMPPLELLDHLDRYQQRGALPASIVEWAERMQAIRRDGKTAIDGVGAETWRQVGERVAA
jgi:DNA polymerase III epsilon subunit-like protein